MRQILLIEPDVDLLGQLAEKLRARGLAVTLADDLPSALARARSHGPHIVFVAATLARRDDFLEKLFSEVNLAGIPRLMLVRPDAPGSLPPDHVSYDDIDRLVARSLEVTPISVPPESGQGELRGDVKQVPLVDLLQLLAMNRRTGVLTVATPGGAGELRIADGEVLDSVFRRLEGEKAFYRLLNEKEGSFVFSPGSPPAMARLTRGTSALLMEGMRQKDEVERLRDELLGRPGSAFIAAGEELDDDERLFGDVLASLTKPKTLDELIDELPSPDLDILQALVELTRRGLARRVEHGADMVPLASPDQLPLLRALTGRLARDGFAGPPRLVVASTPTRVHAFGHSLLRIAGTNASAEPPPTAPVPHDLATLRLGEGSELIVVGLPLVEAFSPLWSLCLPGSGALLSLDAAPSPALVALCEDLEFRILVAPDLVEGFDELEPSTVASALRAAIEQANVA